MNNYADDFTDFLDGMADRMDATIARMEKNTSKTGDKSFKVLVTIKNLDSCSVALENRKGGLELLCSQKTEEGILYMPVEVPQREDMGKITLYETKEPGKTSVEFQGRWADAGELMKAVYNVFSRLMEYEEMFVAGNTPPGVDPMRKAVVGADISELREFDVPELQRLPDTYYTLYDIPRANIKRLLNMLSSTCKEAEQQ